MQARLLELDFEVHEEEFGYWRKFETAAPQRQTMKPRPNHSLNRSTNSRPRGSAGALSPPRGRLLPPG